MNRLIPFACIAVLSIAAAAEVPPRSESMITLVPPASHLDAGDIYHIYPGEDTQITIGSTAQLQRTVVVNRRAVGYFVVPFDRAADAAPISGGAIRIPVASLDAGATAYNDLCTAMLDAAAHPEITYEITGVRDAKKVSAAGAPEEFSLTATGQLTVKGKPIEHTASLRITLLPFTWRTMARYPGDIITMQTSFELKLADLGLEKPGREWADRMADSLTLEVFLCANNVPPDKSLDPNIKQPANVQHNRFLALLRDFNQPDKAYELGRSLLTEFERDAVALNRLAFDTVAEDGIRTRDLAFALKAAERANAVSERKSAQFLDTLARVHFERRELADAVKCSQAALEKLDGVPPPIAQGIRAAAERYKAAAAQ